jgi:hypothetical protein
MTISFFPLGIPFSSSFAVSASLAYTILAGIPSTASVAEYIINYTGPVGPAYKTVSESKVTLL